MSLAIDLLTIGYNGTEGFKANLRSGKAARQGVGHMAGGANN